MNDLTAFEQGGLPTDAEAIKAGLKAARQQAPSISQGMQYLTMQQAGAKDQNRKSIEGLLTFGAAHTEVEEGSEWAVNWKGLQHGFILRDGGSVNAEVYGPIFEPLPDLNQQREARGNEVWRQSYKAQLICISGEDEGMMVEYSGDAAGKVKLFKQVILPGLEAQLDADPDKLYPTLQWEVTSYYSKKQKKDIYEAEGTIVDWLTEEDVAQSAANSDDTSAPEEKEAAPEKAAKEEAPEKASKEEAPAEQEAPARTQTRRRRRTGAAPETSAAK